MEHLTAHTYTCVLWNSVPRDWEQPEAWVPIALAQVRACEEAVVVAQDFAAECVPIECGEVVRPLDALTGHPG